MGILSALWQGLNKAGKSKLLQAASDAEPAVRLPVNAARDIGANGLPIRPPEPFRQSLVGGSADLAEAALPQRRLPQQAATGSRQVLDWLGNDRLIRNPTDADLNRLADLGDELKYVSDTQGNRYVFSAADAHHNNAMRALRANGVEVEPLGSGAEVTNPNAAGFIQRQPDGSFVHEDANLKETGPWANFAQQAAPDAGALHAANAPDGGTVAGANAPARGGADVVPRAPTLTGDVLQPSPLDDMLVRLNVDPARIPYEARRIMEYNLRLHGDGPEAEAWLRRYLTNTRDRFGGGEIPTSTLPRGKPMRQLSGPNPPNGGAADWPAFMLPIVAGGAAGGGLLSASARARAKKTRLGAYA